jgi:Ni/Fe-hydrogenase subunit HybB-like protein
MSALTDSLRRPQILYLALSAIGFAVTFVVVMFVLLAQGHTAFNTTSLGVVWGLPIVTYDYFLLTSTGLAMVASLALLFGLGGFFLIAKRCLWLAIAGLVGGVAVLMLELGYPFRALWATPLNMQVLSPLFWKVLLVGAYTLVLLLTFWRIEAAGWTRTSARALGSLLFVLAVAIALVAGSVFGLMAMRPFWFGGEIPVVFLIESFLGGLAFAIFFTYLAHGFRASTMAVETRAFFGGGLAILFAVVIALHGAFVGGRAITGLWSNAEGMQVWGHIAGSPLFAAEILIGIAVPLVLMATPALRREAWAQIAAAALVMVALFIARYDFIIGGQMVPLFKGSWAPDLIAYVPSATEWLLLLMGVFLANLVNAVGEWRFTLAAQPTLAAPPAAAPSGPALAEPA